MALQWRRENERFRFFAPNGAQQKFIQIVGVGGNHTCIFSAANSVGKTSLVVNILANLIWPEAHIPGFTGELFRDWKFPKRVRYITDPKLVEEIGPFNSEIEKWWPRGKYEAIKAGRNFYSQYKAKDWVIDVMTYDQEGSQFEGVTLGMAIFDEPPTEDIWGRTIARFRQGGIILVVMTPLTHAAWFYDKVVPEYPQSIVYADIEDNCKDHGINGQLEHSNIERMIHGWMITDPDMVEARAHGKAMYLQGTIFKTFNPQVHVLKETVVPPSNATIYQVIDPHTDKPFAIIWAFVDARGDLYIYDEWPNQDFYKWRNCQLTLPDYKNIFQDKEQGLKVHKRIIDRHFSEVTHLKGMTRRTLRDEFRDIGIEFTPSYQAKEEIETGVAKVREYLSYNPDRPIDVMNKPKLFINRHCHNTIKSLSRWSRDPKTGNFQDEYKDFCDVVRYLVSSNPKIDVPAPYTPPVKRW